MLGARTCTPARHQAAASVSCSGSRSASFCVPRPLLRGCKAPLYPSGPSSSEAPNRLVVAASPSPETEEARSPLDAPQEWEVPMPSRRPDIFPEFEKMNKVFLPKPLPGDPEMPDEEYEESTKRTTPGDPDPEQKPGEPPEIPEKPADPTAPEPEKKTDIPNVPE